MKSVTQFFGVQSTETVIAQQPSVQFVRTHQDHLMDPVNATDENDTNTSVVDSPSAEPSMERKVDEQVAEPKAEPIKKPKAAVVNYESDEQVEVPDEDGGGVAKGIDPQRLPHPEKTQPVRILWEYVTVLGLVHVVCALAFVPAFFDYLFTWSGFVLAILGHFLFGMMGITIGYHRLLTHRGFTCPKWLEHGLAILGMCNLQDSPARWVAVHRMHHQHSDHQPDPHSPLVSFLWGHVGWVIVRNRDLDRTSHYERYVRDLLRDRFYLQLERRGGWFFVFIGHVIVITALGAIVGAAVSGGQFSEILRYAYSYAVWTVAVRTVFVLHGTWAVNSLAHVFGYRNYETRDESRNNWLVSLWSHGEGWHNNHHAEPRSAAHGHRWWEFDMSWRIIQMMEWVGLAKNVVRPKAFAKAKTKA